MVSSKKFAFLLQNRPVSIYNSWSILVFRNGRMTRTLKEGIIMSNRINSSDDSITIKVASTIEDLIACQRIRSACFMSGDEPEPYSEQFDGNDFSAATHLLACRNGAPVGSMRIRILNGGEGTEATWEKLSVLPSERGALAILNSIAQAAVQYSVFKGITTIRGLVRDPRIMKFWKRTVNGVITNEPPVVYEGREYRHILIDLRPYWTPCERLTLEKIEHEIFAKHLSERRRALASERVEERMRQRVA
jgi:hypothetical protein